MSIVLQVWTFLLLLLVPPVPTLKPFHTNPRDIASIFANLLNKPDYMSANSNICPELGEEMKLLLAVLSAPSHKNNRINIRQTWGHFATRKDVGMLFMVGLSSNSSLNSNLNEENDLYNDVIRVNVWDSYDNLTLKTISMLMWADIYCPKAAFVLKIDDDVYLNVDRLLNLIEKLNPKERYIHGRVTNWTPDRKPNAFYHISYKQYQSDTPLAFAHGPAYLLSQKIIKELYTEALNYKYIQIEDVFIAGIVANNLKIPRISVKEFGNALTPCAAQTSITQHQITKYQLFDMWRKLHNQPKQNCK